MEMIRTIVVAMFFAGITVGSYYFLSSSPFPWETMENTASIENPTENSSENITTVNQPLAAPTLNTPETSTFADSGPFAPVAISNGDDDDFTLPALDELPPAQKTSTEMATESPMVTATPILDTDLPSLNVAPPAVAAPHEAQVGMMNEISASAAVAPMLDTELPPGPMLSTDISAESATPTVGNMTENPPLYNDTASQTVANPLRTNSPTTNVSYSCAPAVSGMATMQNTETNDVRQYLKIAAEKIQNGNALEVLQSLSKYYGDPRFSAEELSELTNILVQAATLVIYSQQSYLEPAYTVQPGDTVEKIALQYQIPEEFIIRVNGLTAPFTLQPGTQLKVVKGPFHAIVYLDRYEMILTLNGLFAGRFWLGIGGDLIQKDGDFSFAQKTVSPTETYYEFLRVAGVPGCGDFVRVQSAADPNSIGAHALSGPILMNLTDIDSLGALLGPRSQLIMRCSAPKAVSVPQNSVATNAPTQPIQATSQVSMDIPAVNPPVNPAVGVQAPEPVAPEIPNDPASPYSLPGTEPAVAPELPTISTTPDGGVPEAVQLPIL